MTRRALAKAAAILVAGAALPGCIAAIGGDRQSSAGTPNAEALTKLEKRMDRIDERLPKQP